jgi:hypothetical protein
VPTRVYSTNFIEYVPGLGYPPAYTCPASQTMIVRNMTFTWLVPGVDPGLGPALNVRFGTAQALIWIIGQANAQNRTYQWEGREVFTQGPEGPFEPTLECTFPESLAHLRVSGFLLIP